MARSAAAHRSSRLRPTSQPPKAARRLRRPRVVREGIAMESVEASGKTVNEAIEKALAELGAERDEVEVEVLSEGKGMLGRGQAKVRVRLLDDEDDVDEDDVSAELDEGEDEDEAADEL